MSRFYTGDLLAKSDKNVRITPKKISEIHDKPELDQFLILVNILTQVTLKSSKNLKSIFAIHMWEKWNTVVIQCHQFKSSYSKDL